jgi:choline-sulfatase
MPIEDTAARPRGRGRTLLLAVIVLAAGLGVWQSWDVWFKSDPTRPAVLGELVHPGAAAAYNVLLVTLDTTRPDHLGCYGYKKIKTPAIDSLLEHGVRFDDAVTCVPITLPSHASILTGLYPFRHGVHNNGTYRLPESFTTLAEILQEAGYDTAAFVSCFVLDERYGLAQGFTTYNFAASPGGRRGANSLGNERNATDVTTAALDWLESRPGSGGGSAWFLWLHYFDPHFPYESPLGGLPEYQQRPYDAEIAYLDLQFRRILRALDDRQLRQRTLIVLTTDHGEGLGEHGEPTHAYFIYDSTVRVALLLSCPTLFDRAYRVSDRAVATVDLVPTLEDLLGLPRSLNLDGQSLLTAPADPDRAVYVESVELNEAMGCTPLLGLRRHRDKYIQAPAPEYFDLRRDARELDNLFTAGVTPAAALQGQLARLLRKAGAEQSTDAALAPTPDEIRRLASLGYAAGGHRPSSAEPCDPKDVQPLLKGWDELLVVFDRGDFAQALPIAEGLLAERPEWENAVQAVADCQERLGRPGAALAALERFAEHHPSADVYMHMAEILAAQRRWDESEAKLRLVEQHDPKRGAIFMMRGDRRVSEGRYQEAVRLYERAIALDPVRCRSEVHDKLAAAKAHLDDVSRKEN